MNDMINTMFCRQCQETFGNSGCTRVGVCGKRPVTAGLMDELIARLEVLARVYKPTQAPSGGSDASRGARSPGRSRRRTPICAA